MGMCARFASVVILDWLLVRAYSKVVLRIHGMDKGRVRFPVGPPQIYTRMAETTSTLFSTLWAVWKEMASVIWSLIPKMFHFSLWILSGIVILPCVYIAGNLYPTWQEWGEDF